MIQLNGMELLGDWSQRMWRRVERVAAYSKETKIWELGTGVRCNQTSGHPCCQGDEAGVRGADAQRASLCLRIPP